MKSIHLLSTLHHWELFKGFLFQGILQLKKYKFNYLLNFCFSQVRPQAHIDEDKLRRKQRQLKLLIKFYENRIHSLCTSSNKYFGVVKGAKLAILIEASQTLAQLKEGGKFKEYKDSLKLLVKEQFCDKEAVYFIQFGTVATPKRPEPLPFEVGTSRCQNFADQWLTALSGHGSCNLLAALKVALSLEKVDTICVVLSTK